MGSRKKKLTAVAAPGSVKLGKDILGLITVDIVPIVGDKLINRTLGGGDGLRLDARSNLTGDILLDKVLDSLSGGFARQGELSLVGKVLDHKRGPRVTGEVERLAVVNKLDSINVNKVDRTLELFGKRLELLDKLLTGRTLVRVGKKIGDGNTLLGVRAKVFRSNLVKEGHRVLLDKLAELVDIRVGDLTRGEDSVTFIKVLVEDNGGERRILRDRREVTGKVLTEEIRVSGALGVLLEGLRDGVGIVTIGNEDAKDVSDGSFENGIYLHIVSLDKLIMRIRRYLANGREALSKIEELGCNIRSDDAGSLGHVTNDTVGPPCTSIVGGGTVPKHLQGRVPIDTKFTTKTLLNGTVDLSRRISVKLEDKGVKRCTLASLMFFSLSSVAASS